MCPGAEGEVGLKQHWGTLGLGLGLGLKLETNSPFTLRSGKVLESF